MFKFKKILTLGLAIIMASCMCIGVSASAPTIEKATPSEKEIATPINSSEVGIRVHELSSTRKVMWDSGYSATTPYKNQVLNVTVKYSPNTWKVNSVTYTSSLTECRVLGVTYTANPSMGSVDLEIEYENTNGRPTAHRDGIYRTTIYYEV